MARGIQVGDKAPDFTLPSQAGEPVRLATGPANVWSCCTSTPRTRLPVAPGGRAPSRDGYEAFTGRGAEVIGVSSDSVGKHAAFAGHHDLPFTLPSDERAKSARATESRRRSASCPGG
jgi:peroxiredoxin Q/BCP